MKLRYLTLLTTISILSLGVVTGCANPCSAKTKINGSDPTTEVNPCASKNPCAAKSDPCAAKNPCAAKSDPCAAKNPCAAKSN